MDKFIAEQLELYFKDYKDQMLLILIIFSLLSILIQSFFNLYLNKKFEKFKYSLKKNEKYNEMQVEYLKNIYSNVVDFHLALINFIKPTCYTHHTLKNQISSFSQAFDSIMISFHKNKILLTDEIIIQIRAINDKMKTIKKNCSKELDNLSDIEEKNLSDEPQIIYRDSDTEVNAIKQRIEKLNMNNSIQTFEEDINNLRKLIEDYFKELTK